MTSQITHNGIILSVNGNEITVRITDTDSCNTCAARVLCHSTDNGKIKITTDMPRHYNVGDKVTVGISDTAQAAAIWLSIAIPCIILLVVTGVVFIYGSSQGWAALAGIGAVAIYYMSLYIYRQRLRQRWMWKIIP
ncbi:MAG: SoxR reducing system RseC family protein [Pseudoflavonifractor sp.]|nr:SoxR reducing system RseC family protein [Pseudoflavonifractor sp.]